MNGKSEEELIERVLDQIEQGALRQRKQIGVLMGCLLDCVRELSRIRKRASVDAGDATSAIGTPEMRARRALAPYLQDVTEAERNDFLAGKLDPDGVQIGLNGAPASPQPSA